MRLTINEEDVAFSLEHERTLGEVVQGVQAWLGTAGFVITALEADGQELLPAAGTPGPWADKEVGAVGALAVRAEHTGDIRIAHWRAAEQWLSMLCEALADEPPAGGPDPLEDLLEDLPRTADGFGVNPFTPPGSDALARFRARFEGASAPQVRAWSPDRRQEASDLARHLLEMVRRRRNEAEHPREALARGASQLQASMGELKEVSVLLQTGRDRPAMESIIRFADAAQAVMDLLPFLPPDLERSRLLAELTPVLKELVGAFDSKDSVLIGDLLEYEVAPRLERLAPLLGRAG